MARNRSRTAGRKNKVARTRTLCAEVLEPRTLLSAAGVLRELGRMPVMPGGNPVATIAAATASPAPTVATAAAASFSLVTGTTVQLSVWAPTAPAKTL